MLARVRYLIHYDEDSSALYDIIVATSEIEEDWMHFFHKHAEPSVIETCYSIEFQGCQFM